MTHLIDQKYSSLETSNIRKHMFNYGQIGIGHILPEIITVHLSQFHLELTAREMISFIHLFLLIIGDLVPSDNDVRLFIFLNLLEIIEIILSFENSYDVAQSFNC